jgi:hypothetical protein
MRNRRYRTTIRGRALAVNLAADFAAGFCASALLAGAGAGTGPAAGWQKREAVVAGVVGRRDGGRPGCRWVSAQFHCAGFGDGGRPTVLPKGGVRCFR